MLVQASVGYKYQNVKASTSKNKQQANKYSLSCIGRVVDRNIGPLRMTKHPSAKYRQEATVQPVCCVVLVERCFEWSNRHCPANRQQEALEAFWSFSVESSGLTGKIVTT